MKNRHAFSLIELLLVLAILALLMSLLLPSLSASREVARLAHCQATMRGVGAAVGTYGMDNRQRTLPALITLTNSSEAGGEWWDGLLVKNEYVPIEKGEEAIPSKRSPLRCVNDIPEPAMDWPPGPYDGLERSAAYRTSDELRKVAVRPYKSPATGQVEFWTHTSFGINGSNPESNVFIRPSRFGEGNTPFLHPHHWQRPTSNFANVYYSQIEVSHSRLISLYDGFLFHVTGSDLHSARHMGNTRIALIMFDGSALNVLNEDLPSTLYSTGRNFNRDGEVTHWINR
ncbi:MAG: prepilin-type N-terminal cleavage/methylation domain-containing protein [Phycisphaeraceae bacterium]|nr:prepilin-type N-terminal cleavage/methylation domain-containing protein [Phycisphaeraceae bacterium]